MNLSIGRGESRSVLVVFEEDFADIFVLCNLNFILVLYNLFLVYSHKESIDVK